MLKENDDLSSLRVKDQYGDTALDVRFSNEHVIDIKKVAFRFKNNTIEADEKNGLRFSGERSLAGFCMIAAKPHILGAFIGVHLN
jgi:hypothetical protein